MNGEWRPVAGYEGYYSVSNRGEVVSEAREIAHWRGGRSVLRRRALKPDTSDPRGYLRYTLCRDGETERLSAHRLVCEAFHGPAPEDKPFALHRDGNPANNRPENVYWGSASDNMRDKKRHGRNHELNKTHCPQQHPYDVENTYITQQGKRQCRTCSRLRARGLK